MLDGKVHPDLGTTALAGITNVVIHRYFFARHGIGFSRPSWIAKKQAGRLMPGRWKEGR